MLEDRPYPIEIRQAWKNAIGDAGLATEESSQVMSVIEYVQPPMSIEALKRASEIYATDYGAWIDQTIIDTLSQSPEVSTSAPDRPGTNYPVYYAMTHPRQLGDITCLEHRHSRKILSDMFNDAASGRQVSRGNFYLHVIVTRDVMKAVIRFGWTPAPSDTDISESLLSAIHSDTFFAQREQLRWRIKIFEDLLSGELRPGTKKRESHGGGGGSRGKQRKHDEWHQKRLETLAQQTVPVRYSGKPLNDRDLAGMGDSDSELNEIGIQQRQSRHARREGEDASESLILRRDTPSAQTPDDDRQIMRHWLSGAPTNAINSVTDLARLTPVHVQQVMRAPLPGVCRLFASLLLSTGIPSARLTRLTVSSELTAVIGNGDDDRPHWLPEQHLLCYRLIDGPTARDHTPAAQWVILHLPRSMAACLNEQPSLAPGERPFRRARDQLNRQLRRHFTGEGGITPTANRLAATSWLYCRLHAIDDVAAATLAGQFGLSMAAPAAYRQLSRAEVQRLFELTLEQLGWDITTTTTPIPAVTSTLEQCGPLGSSVAQPPSAFAAVFRQMRNAMATPSAQLARWLPGQPVPLEALTTLHQLASAHELLGWQLSTGARPLGPSSKNSLGDGLQWLHDKMSARGRESRVIPLLKGIHDSMIALHHWTEAIITRRLPALGVRIDDKRSGVCDTPAWLQVAPHGRRLILRDMLWRDWSTLPVTDIPDWPSNVTRHSTASWLRHQVSDAQVDALLGHARHGRMLSSPRAEAPLGQQHSLRRALTEWIQACGYRPLHWERMPWH